MEDGSVTEFTADGRYSNPEVKTVDGKVVETRTTWGTYRVTGPRQLEMKYRLEGLAKKPEFVHQVEVKEITPDHLVYKIDSAGYGDTWTAVTLKRIRD